MHISFVYHYSYNTCGCISTERWDIRLLILPGTDEAIVPALCDKNDACFTNASKKYMNSIDLQLNSEYACPKQCSQTDFLMTQSSSSAPVEWEMNSIKVFVENSRIPLPLNWTQTSYEHMRESYLALSIARRTNVVEVYQQSPKLEMIDVLSNIGGQTGLWIGISLLSIMEFIEMLYRLLRYECQQILRVRQQIMPQ
jgi:hypothetical protein